MFLLILILILMIARADEMLSLIGAIEVHGRDAVRLAANGINNILLILYQNEYFFLSTRMA